MLQQSICELGRHEIMLQQSIEIDDVCFYTFNSVCFRMISTFLLID